MREKSDFLLLAVDAPQKLRFQRAIERNSLKDQISREQFQQQELLEAENQDPTKQNIRACQALADIVLDNGGDKQQLRQQIDAKI